MNTTTRGSPFAPSRMAVPRPVTSRASLTDMALPTRTLLRHAVALLDIIVVFAMAALAERAITTSGPSALPLWTIAVAGLGAWVISRPLRRSGARPMIPHRWRRTLSGILAALSATSLMMALVLRGPYAGPLLGVGLSGILAFRLLALPARGIRNLAGAESIARVPSVPSVPSVPLLSSAVVLTDAAVLELAPHRNARRERAARPVGPLTRPAGTA